MKTDPADPAPGPERRRTVWVLGDQLTDEHGPLGDARPDDTTVLFVVSTEVLARERWHRQRLHVVLAGMARLAIRLRSRGFVVDERIAPTYAIGIADHFAEHRPDEIVVMDPSSWAGRRNVRSLPGVRVVSDDRFLCHEDLFAQWAGTRRSRLRMEDFYRWQRTRLGVLLEPDGEPSGGRWNFDADNREPAPRDGRTWPEPERFALDEVDERITSFIDRHAPGAFGDPYDGWWPTTTEQARARLARVVAEVLPRFGPHEDVMLRDSWHLAHTLLSSALNLGMIRPHELVEAAEHAYRSGLVPIASAEGFIRQVIGWREYVWGLYWLWGAGYAGSNELEARAPLPAAFLGQATEMRCVAHTVDGVERRGWNHHIERLMVIGNLSLLTGVDPTELTRWMRVSYVDGAEWVMVPNVVGMALHADGGRMATKPYASGGAYIKRMSDHCKGCAYDPTKRTGERACPFTTMYWDFLARHEQRFRSNHRMANQLSGLRRLGDLESVRRRAEAVRQTILGD